MSKRFLPVVRMFVDGRLSRRKSFRRTEIARVIRRGSAATAAFLAVLLAGMVVPARTQAQTYTDIHDWDCSVEGCSPSYPAILAQGRDGNLYGTTNAGGTSGMGTAFRMTTAGVVTTLHNFSGVDGQNPVGGLTLGLDGNFYGTTVFGGANNAGTLFKMSPNGTLITLHSFGIGDGANPHGAPVVGRNGVLYGTTCSQFGPWTGYSITTSGAFKNLTSLVPPCPFDGLILGSDGNFYGSSQVGGTTYQGTVFRMTPAGAITILYSFDSTHGSTLYSPVVQGNDGNLYGTTSGGGSMGGGVVFKLTLGGNLTVLHEFDAGSATDGSTPFAGLVAASDGNFYGATGGGENFGTAPNGNLFKITPGGIYSSLYDLDGPHGANIVATPMQHSNGTIYGLADRGGLHTEGVAYSFSLGLKRVISLVSNAAPVGQTVQILGGGFTGTTGVKFGTASAAFTVVSDSYLTAVVPASAITGLVSVATPSGTLKSSRQFFVVPVVSSFSPASGPVGTVVTISGTGFGGATQVTFGGVKATSFTVVSSSQITATVPASAVTGKIGVKTAGGTAASAGNFTVMP